MSDLEAVGQIVTIGVGIGGVVPQGGFPGCRAIRPTAVPGGYRVGWPHQMTMIVVIGASWPPGARFPQRRSDGLPDNQEAALGTDPANADTDGDGLTDGFRGRSSYLRRPLRAIPPAISPAQCRQRWRRISDGAEAQ